MTAVYTPRPAPPLTPIGPADRLLRQVEAIDAWNCDRRAREQALAPAHLTRHDRMDVTRQFEVLRRTQDAIADRAARALRGEVGPIRVPPLTGVIAHRHAWFAEKLAVLLGARGVTIVACTDNGADALGAVVAEQPDVVLTSDRLAMISCDALLEQTRLFAPLALRVVQGCDGQPSDALRMAPKRPSGARTRLPTWQTRSCRCSPSARPSRSGPERDSVPARPLAGRVDLVYRIIIGDALCGVVADGSWRAPRCGAQRLPVTMRAEPVF